MLASIQQYAGDRFLFAASDPLNGTDAVTLKQKPQDEQRLFFTQVHIAEKPFGLRLKVTLAVAKRWVPLRSLPALTALSWQL